MEGHNDIILYHYSFSPYARRIVWYLALRGIGYAECEQPFIMPRPDLEAIGVKYRRIPVLAHGGHVYCDTRRILTHLEAAFAASSQQAGMAAVTTPSERAYARLLEKWIVEAGVFGAAAGLLPVDLPAMKDPAFMRDREQMTGRKWSAEAVLQRRPENLAAMRDAFAMLEEQVLGDGREWVLGGQAPSLADIEAVWPFHWLVGIPGALPADLFSPKIYPRVYAWIDRFQAAYAAARKRAPRPVKVKGEQAASQVLSAAAAASGNGSGRSTGFAFDTTDPIGLAPGQTVDVYPTDSGFSHRDRGRLVGLSGEESVIEASAPSGGKVFVHFPRSQFRIVPVDAPRL